MNVQQLPAVEEQIVDTVELAAVPEAPLALGDALQLIRLDALMDAAEYLNEVVVRFGGE